MKISAVELQQRCSAFMEMPSTIGDEEQMHTVVDLMRFTRLLVHSQVCTWEMITEAMAKV